MEGEGTWGESGRERATCSTSRVDQLLPLRPGSSYGPVWTAAEQCPREAMMESKIQHPDLAPLQNRAHCGICLRVRMSMLLEEVTVRRAAPQAWSPLPGLPPPLSSEMEALSNLGHPDLLGQNHRSPPSVLSPICQPLQLPPHNPTSPMGGSALSCPPGTGPTSRSLQTPSPDARSESPGALLAL